MPIYEYRCIQCDNTFEEWSKSASSCEDTHCPSCGGDAKQLISNTAFILKGSGWYATEYGNRKSDEQGKENTSSDKAESLSESSSNKINTSEGGASSTTTSINTSSLNESQKISEAKPKDHQQSKPVAVQASSEVKNNSSSNSSE